MTPKEKSDELYNRFHVWDTMNHKEVKTLTLIAVDEMIDVLSKDINPLVNYWFEVKQEIEKL